MKAYLQNIWRLQLSSSLCKGAWRDAGHAEFFAEFLTKWFVPFPFEEANNAFSHHLSIVTDKHQFPKKVFPASGWLVGGLAGEETLLLETLISKWL